MPEPSSLTPARPRGAWMIRLYPPSWRRRYAEELSGLLAMQALSPSVFFDLLGGAIDAWVSPQPNVQHPPEGKAKMSLRSFSCVCGEKPYTIRESLVGAGTILGVTLLLTVVQQRLKASYGPVPAVEALWHTIFPAILILSANCIYLQRRSWRAQAIFVGGLLVVVYLIMLASATLAH